MCDGGDLRALINGGLIASRDIGTSTLSVDLETLVLAVLM